MLYTYCNNSRNIFDDSSNKANLKQIELPGILTDQVHAIDLKQKL